MSFISKTIKYVVVYPAVAVVALGVGITVWPKDEVKIAACIQTHGEQYCDLFGDVLDKAKVDATIAKKKAKTEAKITKEKAVTLAPKVEIANYTNSQQKLTNDLKKVGLRGGVAFGNTLVIFKNVRVNPFLNKDSFAREYHPGTINGQTCKETGIKYIQVRNPHTDTMLSGISCKD
jgi:hypothetical protein